MNGKTPRMPPMAATAPSPRGAELVHRLAETGRARLLPQAAADGAMLAWLRPVLAQALASEEITPLSDTGWWIRCALYLGRLRCQLWRVQWRRASGLPVPDPAATPHVRMTVTEAKGEAPPLLESRRAGVLAIENPVLADLAMSEAPELERSIAWAWLTGTGP